MIDLNTIISNALTAAITSAIAPLNERITALEGICQTQHTDMLAMRDRITALEAAAPQPVGVDPKTLAEASLNYLNDQEWFWEKMRGFADSAAEAAMYDHTSEYDHDSYDAVVSDSDDFVKSDVLEEAVREAIDNLTFEVSVS